MLHLAILTFFAQIWVYILQFWLINGYKLAVAIVSYKVQFWRKKDQLVSYNCKFISQFCVIKSELLDINYQFWRKKVTIVKYKLSTEKNIRIVRLYLTILTFILRIFEI